jgi:N-acetylmuramic acid 6-phosphate (MurNAc-6-P) etherase
VALEAAGRDVKTAIVMVKAGISREVAQARLAAVGGKVGRAIAVPEST